MRIYELVISQTFACVQAHSTLLKDLTRDWFVYAHEHVYFSEVAPKIIAHSYPKQQIRIHQQSSNFLDAQRL